MFKNNFASPFAKQQTNTFQTAQNQFMQNNPAPAGNAFGQNPFNAGQAPSSTTPFGQPSGQFGAAFNQATSNRGSIGGFSSQSSQPNFNMGLPRASTGLTNMMGNLSVGGGTGFPASNSGFKQTTLNFGQKPSTPGGGFNQGAPQFNLGASKSTPVFGAPAFTTQQTQSKLNASPSKQFNLSTMPQQTPFGTQQTQFGGQKPAFGTTPLGTQPTATPFGQPAQNQFQPAGTVGASGFAGFGAPTTSPFGGTQNAFGQSQAAGFSGFKLGGTTQPVQFAGGFGAAASGNTLGQFGGPFSIQGSMFPGGQQNSQNQMWSMIEKDLTIPEFSDFNFTLNLSRLRDSIQNLCFSPHFNNLNQDQKIQTLQSELDVFRSSRDYFLEQDKINISIMDNKKGFQDSSLQNDFFKRSLFQIKYGNQVKQSNYLMSKSLKQCSKDLQSQFLAFREEMRVNEEHVQKSKQQLGLVKQEYKQSKNLTKECKFAIEAIEKAQGKADEGLQLVEQNNNIFQWHTSRIRNDLRQIDLQNRKGKLHSFLSNAYKADESFNELEELENLSQGLSNMVSLIKGQCDELSKVADEKKAESEAFREIEKNEQGSQADFTSGQRSQLVLDSLSMIKEGSLVTAARIEETRGALKQVEDQLLKNQVESEREKVDRGQNALTKQQLRERYRSQVEQHFDRLQSQVAFLSERRASTVLSKIELIGQEEKNLKKLAKKKQKLDIFDRQGQQVREDEVQAMRKHRRREFDSELHDPMVFQKKMKVNDQGQDRSIRLYREKANMIRREIFDRDKEEEEEVKEYSVLKPIKSSYLKMRGSPFT